MKELFVVSTLFQCLSLAAAAESGTLPQPKPGTERILVVNSSTMIPEVTTPFADGPGFAAVAEYFDRTVDLGELLWPYRPGQFSPRDAELHIWERLLRSHWGLGDGPVHLFVESIQVNPAAALCRVFTHARVSVHSDGLMSYGPTRNPIQPEIAQRLDALYYVELVPGLEPVLLREHTPRLAPIPASALAVQMEALDRVLPAEPALAEASAPTDGTDGGTALLLGQYLADLSILSLDEEVELHREMLLRARDLGLSRCVFKPHPSAGPAAVGSIRSAAAEAGIELQVLESATPAEVLMLRLRPAVVISCFSTALATAHFALGLRVEAVGTGLLLERLSPYQNSNRIPVTLIDALFTRGIPAPAQEPPQRPGELQQLVETVAFCMRSEQLEELRPTATLFLATHLRTHAAYFKRRRLTALGLPGGASTSPLRRHAGRIKRKALRIARAAAHSAPASVRQRLKAGLRHARN